MIAEKAASYFELDTRHADLGGLNFTFWDAVMNYETTLMVGASIGRLGQKRYRVII
jgi:hypothetical protein